MPKTSSNNNQTLQRCMAWDPTLLLIMLASNAGIAVAYFSMAGAMLYFAAKRRQMPHVWMFRLFAAFTVCCGIGHLLRLPTAYVPGLELVVAVDAITALISLTAAALLWPLIPKALKLKSASELEHMNQQLHDMNERLTQANLKLEAANEHLAIARDQALETSNLKSAFVANISHELRTPLNGVLGMNELLLHTNLTPKQRELSETVQEQACELLSIVNDILDLSKLEAGKMKVEAVRMNPDRLVNECVSVMMPAAMQKGLELQVEIDPAIPSAVIGDPLRIHQVLLVLLNNAVKFTKKGSITVSVKVLEDTQSLVRFAVCDTGIGMAPDEQRYLFLPFTQVDGSSTRRFGGAGVGLSIAKKLVELMGGDIGVDSTKGTGSLFWFSVPLTVCEKGFQDLAMTMSPEIKGAGEVLIVEDHPALRLLASKQLENLGVKSCTVGTGKEALEAVVKGNYEMILLDCNLPDIDGYEVTRLIRRSEADTGKHVNIVALTAGALRSDLEKCLRSGMDDYLSKPYTLDELRRKVERWVMPTAKTINISKPTIDA